MPIHLARPSGARVGIVRRVPASGPLVDVSMAAHPEPAASRLVLLRPTGAAPAAEDDSEPSLPEADGAECVDVEAPPVLCCRPVSSVELDGFTDRFRHDAESLQLMDLPGDAQYAVWETFRRSLDPLRVRGQLGWVIFRFGDDFVPRQDRAAYLGVLSERLPDDRIAVDLPAAWLDDGELPHPHLVAAGIRVCLDLARVPSIPERVRDEIGVVLVPFGDSVTLPALEGLPPDAHVLFEVLPGSPQEPRAVEPLAG